MNRMFAALAVLLAFAVIGRPQRRNSRKIIWHGQSFFEVISSRARA